MAPLFFCVSQAKESSKTASNFLAKIRPRMKMVLYFQLIQTLRSLDLESQDAAKIVPEPLPLTN